MFDFMAGGWLTITLVGAAAGAIGLAILYFRRQGAQRERARREAARRKAIDTASEIDDAVAGRSPETNRGRLKQWQKS